MPHFNYKILITCHVNTFTAYSHNFVKISEFVMVNEGKGTPVEMTHFTSYLRHPCTIENICTPQRGVYNMSLLDHCLGRTLLLVE